MDGKIILEEHFSTELNNQFWDAGGENQRNGEAYAEDVARRLLDPELCLAEMDQAGVDHCVLSLTSPGVQSVSDAGTARELAQACNDHLHSIMQRHPDRFSGFAALAVQDPRFAADELQRCVEKLGFKGALINGYSNIGPGESVQYLDEEPVRELWDRAAKLNVPIYLHPREPLQSQTEAELTLAPCRFSLTVYRFLRGDSSGEETIRSVDKHPYQAGLRRGVSLHR